LSICRVKVNCQIRKFKITKMKQKVMPTYCHIDSDSMDVIANDYILVNLYDIDITDVVENNYVK
jgi:hypothetical protein